MAEKLKILGTLCSLDEYSRSVSLLASTPDPAGDQPGIKEWDLERFQKNPVILWGHDRFNLPIGRATEIEITPEGLKMRVEFATEAANPLAEQVWQGTREQIVRACSVGYEPAGPGKALLLEVSMVPIGLDENAGTPDLNPDAVLDDDAVRIRVSGAAREMANARARIMRTRNIALEKSLEEKTDATDEAKKRKAARKQVELALARGDLKRGQCQARGCKSVETEAHHDDYSKSTDVRWFCKEHHEQHHARTDGVDLVQRFDVGGRLIKAKRTSFGGAYIPARISRIGVLTYNLPDGTQRRELRHPDEVFKADSLATLDSIPVIDIRDHTAILSTEDYKRAAVGHLKSYRHDSRFVESELVVQDSDTLDRIDAGERTEISCGYVCVLDMTPGVWNGEAYDCVQRDIKYNHVALCPPNRGRAGPEVGLRLDQKPDARWGVATIDEEKKGKDMKIVRLDGTDFEFGSEAHVAKVDAMAQAAVAKVKLDSATEVKAKLDAMEVEKAAATKAKDEAQAKLDAAEAALKQERTDAASEKVKREEEEKKKAEEAKKGARSRRRLERFFSRYFSGEDDMEDGDEEEKAFGKEGDDEEKKKGKKSKLDSLDAKLDSMTDRELMLLAIQRSDPKFDATDRSDDYIRARFDAAVEQVQRGRSVDGVVRAANEGLGRLDASDETTMDKVRKKRDEAMANMWKGGDAAKDGGAR